ncbi:MAG: DUF448 domain-containing protein [Myxococcota bacterium]
MLLQMAKEGLKNCLRACAGCKSTLPTQLMLRFVCSPQGQLAFDVRAKLQGRGAWVCPQWLCVQRSLQRRVFARCLRVRAFVAKDAMSLSEHMCELLKKQVLSTMGLAYRAGQCCFGKQRCLQAMQQSKTKAFICACDLSEKTSQSLSAYLVEHDAQLETLCPPVTKQEMGTCLGKQQVGCVAVLSGGLATCLLFHLRRLCRLQLSLSEGACEEKK